MRAVMVLVVLVGICLAVALVEAQVNFSPSWGKRSNDDLSQTLPFSDSCKIPFDSVLRIQKLIQVNHDLFFIFFLQYREP